MESGTGHSVILFFPEETRMEDITIGHMYNPPFYLINLLPKIISMQMNTETLPFECSTRTITHWRSYHLCPECWWCALSIENEHISFVVINIWVCTKLFKHPFICP